MEVYNGSVAAVPERTSGAPIDLSRIKRSELVGFVGAAVLAVSLFLPWFATSCNAHLAPPGCDQNSLLNGARGQFNAFQTYKILDWALLAACIAPFVLAYIIARGHELGWRPGEVTMLVGMLAFALILLNGIILGRPGSQTPHGVDISLKIGYLVGLVGAALISAGGIIRQAEGARGRKPPGVP